MDLVLAQVTARLEAESGTGEVPVPRQTRALQILREVTRWQLSVRRDQAKRGTSPGAPAESWPSVGVQCTVACGNPVGMDGVRLWRERGQW
jgi:hypothetical protein